MKKKTKIIFCTAIAIFLIAGVFLLTQDKMTKVKIETNYGEIVAELYPDKTPMTVENFKTYVDEGFYENTLFHRVIDGFMIQGGGFDAETGEQKETHGEIKLESDNGLSNDRGTIAMARTSVPDSATSQFFINTVDNEFLNYGYRDEGYAVFGKVIEGMGVVDTIEKVETDSSDKPVNNVIILKISFIN
jgi:cyclophilin family peptidyl-prolyl cis-trans isomerase